jgi:hypothetical protein
MIGYMLDLDQAAESAEHRGAARAQGELEPARRAAITEGRSGLLEWRRDYPARSKPLDDGGLHNICKLSMRLFECWVMKAGHHRLPKF